MLFGFYNYFRSREKYDFERILIINKYNIIYIQIINILRIQSIMSQ